MAKIAGLVLKLPLFLGNKNILDFGCGRGQLVKKLQKQNYKAFGYDPFSLDFKSMPAGKFNFISCIEVLEHLQNPQDFFEKAGKVLAERGCILISTGMYDLKKHNCNWQYISPVAGHISLFSKKALGIFFQKNKFHIVFKISSTVYLIRKDSGIILNSFDLLLKIISKIRADVSALGCCAQDGAGQKAPIFIVGCPRSGTTLLRLMLNSHSKISIPDETAIFHFLYHYPGRQKKIRKNIISELQNPSNLIRKALGSKAVDEALLKIKSEKSLNAKKIINFLFSSFLGQGFKSVWGEKTPNHVFYIKDIFKVYPDAAVIYVVRDPRAVAASMKRYAGSDFWMIKFVDKAALMWYSCHKAGLKFKDKIHMIKYEDLVLSPQACLKNMFKNYLGIPYEPNMLEYAKEVEKSNVPLWHKSTAEGPKPENINRWQNELSASEIGAIEMILKKEMQSLGYELKTRQKAGFSAFAKKLVYLTQIGAKPRLKLIKDAVLQK